MGSESTIEQSVSQTPSFTAASVCGDGITAWDEGCDDGNTVSYDGCNSQCRVERLWTCVNDVITTKSTCTLIAPPAFSGIQISANTSYTASYCEYRITVLANFFFQTAIKVSIQGLPLRTNASLIDVSGSGVAREASWNQTSNTLVVDVTIPDQNYLFFTVASLSPPTPSSSVDIQLYCSLCIADLPGRPVPSLSVTLPLSFQDLPPQVCADSNFGPSCQYTCYGTIVGDKCVCSKGQFGFLCNQVATKNELLSPPPKLVDPVAPTTITSAAGIGVSIPAGALGEGLTISVEVYELPNLDVGAQAGVIVPAGPIVQFEPSGIRFQKPVEIFTPFNPSKIPAGKNPTIFYNNELAFPPWERQESEVVPGKNLTRAAVMHFSGYMTMGADPPVIPSPPGNSTTTITMTSSSPLPAADAPTKRINIGLILGLIGGGVGVLVTVSASMTVYKFAHKKDLASLGQRSEEPMPEMADRGIASAALVLRERPEEGNRSPRASSEQQAVPAEEARQGQLPTAEGQAAQEADAGIDRVLASGLPQVDEEIQPVSADDVMMVERSHISSPSQEMLSDLDLNEMFSFRFPRLPLEGIRFVSDLAFAKQDLESTPRHIEEDDSSSGESTARGVRSIVL
ncbi:hypothetical protein GUITHDRAFT_111587 [Guillardia theta CCMP2712]|uniref:EGF-like domain-containing protein n=1 Tax=Guillardia theta (strain CCMP2712) TaxID=905079 RepID=L1J1D7_GUITC|nr:hypothetical protein GUITHDRAFT_111587 [Guillardia theta CCMP2712]EKX42311.1 hypothetical protein GUITHDRAFT_111587 [Guillardia theta CCMP2712]|eukprot:XP_005829291.1 hypothetical protein GUITHDRAFT_111587 [Guillardia theta CCMP2712]